MHPDLEVKSIDAMAHCGSNKSNSPLTWSPASMNQYGAATFTFNGASGHQSQQFNMMYNNPPQMIQSQQAAANIPPSGTSLDPALLQAESFQPSVSCLNSEAASALSERNEPMMHSQKRLTGFEVF